MSHAGKVMVTGASGFVGRHVCAALRCAGWDVLGLSRSALAQDGVVWTRCGELDALPEDALCFDKVDTVIHLAARAHILSDSASDPLAEFRKVNVEGSLRLASLAARGGVRRFVFVSSVGVNGNATRGRAFDESSAPGPVDSYAVSKYEAELALHDLAQRAGMELVIVRPPLVYGPGNPGNFLKLLKLIRRGLPLPIGSVRNVRSFIYVENLASALMQCVFSQAAANRLYLVSDGEDLSTPDLVRRLGRHMQRASRLIPVPGAILFGAAKVLGKGDVVEKLCSSLQVDSAKIRRELNWSPPVGMDEGLEKTVEWFMGAQQSL